MDISITKKPGLPIRGDNPNDVSAIRRIRFVPAPDGEGRLLRRYVQPTVAVALETDVGVNDLSTAIESNRLIFVQLTAATPEETRQVVQRWWTAGIAADPAVETTDVEVGDYHVRWRPGRIVVESEKPISVELTDALIDLAYHEGTLRDLERKLGAFEATAVDDVPRAYRIKSEDKAHWSKFGESIEALARMRFTFVRLQPELERTKRKLPRGDRRLLAHLEAFLDIENRLEGFSERNEACEDLYEGATDRVADYRWYRTGHQLEMWIVVLLVFEVLLLISDISVQVWFHMSE